MNKQATNDLHCSVSVIAKLENFGEAIEKLKTWKLRRTEN